MPLSTIDHAGFMAKPYDARRTPVNCHVPRLHTISINRITILTDIYPIKGTKKPPTLAHIYLGSKSCRESYDCRSNIGHVIAIPQKHVHEYIYVKVTRKSMSHMVLFLYRFYICEMNIYWKRAFRSTRKCGHLVSGGVLVLEYSAVTFSKYASMSYLRCFTKDLVGRATVHVPDRAGGPSVVCVPGRSR